MATKPAGASAYGDISNTRKLIHDDPSYRGDVVVSTPSASYTADQLIDLINAAVAGVAVTTFRTTGKAKSVEKYTGTIATLTNRINGSGYTNGTYLNVPLRRTEGVGEGAVADITVTGGAVSAVTLKAGGRLFAVNDTLTALLPGGTGFTIDVGTLA
jgi:hypothetical protein